MITFPFLRFFNANNSSRSSAASIKFSSRAVFHLLMGFLECFYYIARPNLKYLFLNYKPYIMFQAFQCIIRHNTFTNISTLLSLCLLMCITNSMFCQQKFSKQYNFFDQGNGEHVEGMEYINDNIFLLTEHYYNKVNRPCAGLVKLDKNGNKVFSKPLPWFYSPRGNNMIRDDSTLVISGHYPTKEAPAFYLYKSSLSGDSVFLKKYDIENDIFVYNYGVAAINNHYVLYGVVQYENESIEGVLLWVDKSGNLDTVLYFPEYEKIVAARTNSNDELLILYDRYDSNRVFMHRGFLKFNSSKRVIWQWETEARHPLRVYFDFTILNDNSICMIERAQENILSCGIWRISDDGELLWTYNFNPSGILKEPFVYEVKQTDNGDLIACGDHSDIYRRNDDQHFLGGYVCRMTIDGEMLWERHYTKVDSTDGAHTAILTSIVEREDENIYLAGYMGPYSGRRDAWLMMVGEDGCISDEYCGKRNFLSVNTGKKWQNKPCGINIFNNISNTSLGVTIEENTLKSVDYLIYESSGLLVKSGTTYRSRNQWIDISALTQGTYFIVFSSKETGTLCAKKFIKVH